MFIVELSLEPANKLIRICTGLSSQQGQVFELASSSVARLMLEVCRSQAY